MLAELTLAGVKKLQLGTTAGRVSCPGTSPVITIFVLRLQASPAYQGEPRESARWRKHKYQQACKVIQELP
jgi:hypothetical protein